MEAQGQSDGWSLEVGCGHGHWMVDYAEQHPERFCVGIDLATKRIERAQTKVRRRGLPNVHFIKAELFEFFELLPERVHLDAVFMLFPDPWPKKRHFRRRMLQAAFLTSIARRMATGARFYFQSDHAALFEWAEETVSEHPDWVALPADEVEAIWPLRTVSYFEALCGTGRRLVAERCSD